MFFALHFSLRVRHWKVASDLVPRRRNPRDCCDLGMACFLALSRRSITLHNKILFHLPKLRPVDL
jgi:hypothetical protein